MGGIVFEVTVCDLQFSPEEEIKHSAEYMGVPTYSATFFLEHPRDPQREVAIYTACHSLK